MNILIADSGTSKTDWVLLGEESPQFIRTEGLNPQLISATDFLTILTHELKPNLLGNAIHKVFFYSSGCDHSQKQDEVAAYFREVFEFAKISVSTDLEAGGVALFGEGEGFVGVLGSGSHAGIFKKGQMIEKIPVLEYPRGNEGSGSDIGKRIMMEYLNGNMPKELKEFLESNIQVSLEEIFLKIQTPKEAKLFLSEVCKVMTSKSNHAFMQHIIYEGFNNFLVRITEAFPEKVSVLEIGFVGTVASVFEAELRACAKQKGMEVFSIVRSPIEHIALHYKRILK
ncbi:MAG: hypothetical protein RI564_04395 [Gracilimonas sp.]|nr:hypothetical protein [Gracilimonas sp.]